MVSEREQFLAEDFVNNAKKGNYERALDIAEDMLASNSKSAFAILGVSYCLYMLGRFRDSLEFINSNINKIDSPEIRKAISLIQASDLFNLDYHSSEIEQILKRIEINDAELKKKVEFLLVLYYLLNHRYDDAVNELESAKIKIEFIELIAENVLKEKMNNDSYKVLREFLKEQRV